MNVKNEVFLGRPWMSLTLLFILWKFLLLVIAFLSPGPGYDSSTAILHPQDPWIIPLVRWDAIYYTQGAQRGNRFEQDWAFGLGVKRLFGLGAQHLGPYLHKYNLFVEAWCGVAVSHLAHFLATLTLHRISMKLFNATPLGRSVAYVAACLYIVSPAGIFLSTPFAESIFAALQFLGYNAYIAAWITPNQALASQCCRILVAGCCFGIAMLMRSNGLLSGILFAYDAVVLSLAMVSKQRSTPTFVLLGSTVLAGSFIALGSAYPQFLAYQEYCLNTTGDHQARVWCSHRIPSIYTFVQAHYWGNGPFRYWTFSNLPLFLLGAPMFWALGQSSYWTSTLSIPSGPATRRKGTDTSRAGLKQPTEILRLIAVPQAVLAVATLVNSHVQIITRMASGYPIWYLWLAYVIQGDNQAQVRNVAKYFSRWMVMYAMIQGGLYAAFLPPA